MENGRVKITMCLGGGQKTEHMQNYKLPGTFGWTFFFLCMGVLESLKPFEKSIDFYINMSQHHHPTILLTEEEKNLVNHWNENCML